MVNTSSLQPRWTDWINILDNCGSRGNSAILLPSLVRRPSSSKALRECSCSMAEIMVWPRKTKQVNKQLATDTQQAQVGSGDGLFVLSTLRKKESFLAFSYTRAKLLFLLGWALRFSASTTTTTTKKKKTKKKKPEAFSDTWHLILNTINYNVTSRPQIFLVNFALAEVDFRCRGRYSTIGVIFYVIQFPWWLIIKHFLDDLGTIPFLVYKFPNTIEHSRLSHIHPSTLLQSQGSKSSLLRTQLYCSRPIDNDNFHRSIKQLIKATRVI